MTATMSTEATCSFMLNAIFVVFPSLRSSSSVFLSLSVCLLVCCFRFVDRIV